MECKICSGPCIKKGCQNRRQKYYCKTCQLYQQKTYRYRRYTKENERMIIKLNNEGMGVSGISRITGISKSHVVNKLKAIASKLQKSTFQEQNQEYEMDEMYTYIGNRRNYCCIMYAINKHSRQVIDIVIGERTKENLNKVIASIMALSPRKIYTDLLNVYPGLINSKPF